MAVQFYMEKKLESTAINQHHHSAMNALHFQ